MPSPYRIEHPPARRLTRCLGSSEDTMIDFITELWSFMRVRKKYWLLPIILMLAVFGALIVLAKGSAVAPFIYTLF
jgi:hypothetical protein